MPNPDARAVVTVTQEDREAAEALALTLFDGDYDLQSIARTFTQAFARHRIAAEARVSARVEELLRDAVDNAGDESELAMAEGTLHAFLCLHTDGAGS